MLIGQIWLCIADSFQVFVTQPTRTARSSHTFRAPFTTQHTQTTTTTHADHTHALNVNPVTVLKVKVVNSNKRGWVLSGSNFDSLKDKRLVTSLVTVDRDSYRLHLLSGNITAKERV